MSVSNIGAARSIGSMLLVLLFSSCATGRSAHPYQPQGMTVTARVVASTEVSLFGAGTTEEVAYSYRLQPMDDSGQQIVAIGQDARCPALGDPEAIYLLALERRPMRVGLREGQGETVASDLFIALCEIAGVR